MNDFQYAELDEETSALWDREMKKLSDKGGFAALLKNVPGTIQALDLNSYLPTFFDIAELKIHVEYIIPGLLPKQSITLLHGRGGGLKTWLALELGARISEGNFFAGLATGKTPTYFVDYENSLPMIVDRANIIGASGMKLWHISNDIPPPRLDSSDWILFKSLLPGLIIIDTLRSCQLLDENSSQDMAKIMGRLKQLRDIGHTILLLHHTQKADARTYKGSTAILDLCDHVLGLERVKEIGSDQVVDDNETDLPLRLGTREKTRFEPFAIFLRFDPSRGFYPAGDPDDESLSALRDLLSDHELNQTEFFKLAKYNLEMRRRKFLYLLRKGEGRLWTKSKSAWRNQTVYCSVVHEQSQLFDSQLAENTQLSSCPGTKKISETTASCSVVPVVPPLIGGTLDNSTTDLPGITDKELEAAYEEEKDEGE